MEQQMKKEDAYNLIEGEWNGFRFRRIEPKDHAAVFDHIAQYFLRDEPTCKLFGWNEEFVADFTRLVAAMIGLGDNLSFLAEDIITNEVAAVRITYVHQKDASFEHLRRDSRQMKQLVQLLSMLEEMAKPKEKLGIDTWVDLFVASTATKYRRLGLTGEFYTRSINFLTACGYKHALVIVSSPYTRAATARRGFVDLARVDYKDFRDDDGNSVFNPEELNEEHFAVSRVKIL